MPVGTAGGARTGPGLQEDTGRTAAPEPLREQQFSVRESGTLVPLLTSAASAPAMLHVQSSPRRSP